MFGPYGGPQKPGSELWAANQGWRAMEQLRRQAKQGYGGTGGIIRWLFGP